MPKETRLQKYKTDTCPRKQDYKNTKQIHAQENKAAKIQNRYMPKETRLQKYKSDTCPRKQGYKNTKHIHTVVI
jgi:hypothetical protein